jgi:hypothetical protein
MGTKLISVEHVESLKTEAKKSMNWAEAIESIVAKHRSNGHTCMSKGLPTKNAATKRKPNKFNTWACRKGNIKASKFDTVIPDHESQPCNRGILPWAKYSTRILNSNTAKQLHRGSMKTIFAAYAGVPALSTFMNAEVVRAKIEAQAKLLQFNLDLKRHLNCEIGEKEYEHSKQSAIGALASLITYIS